MKTLRALLLALPVVTLPVSGLAAEGGKTLYLLGKRGPLAGLIPKPGWYVTNDLYHYQGDISAEIPIAASIDSGVSADAWVNVFQLTWITETQLAGARLAFGALVPYGNLTVDANASAQLPAGLAIAKGKSDEVTDFGDPALAAALDYRSGNHLHLELVYKQHLPNGLGLGLAGYYYQQLTADSGSRTRKSG